MALFDEVMLQGDDPTIYADGDPLVLWEASSASHHSILGYNMLGRMICKDALRV
jgi:hypothetical protein